MVPPQGIFLNAQGYWALWVKGFIKGNLIYVRTTLVVSCNGGGP